MRPFRIFIGHDPREMLAAAVLAHSINVRASLPIAIVPINLRHLQAVYTRPRGPLEATEFSISRFLVPYLAGFEGVSLYLDCDMLCRVDVAELADRAAAQAEPWTVMLVPHDYQPRTGHKMEGQVQTVYPRKNWSSLMLFNNAACQTLTPAYVATASGLALHRFHWAPDAGLIPLPLEYNWLVGEYPPNPAAKLYHYTLGGPWFEDYRDCDHAAEWLAERDHLLGAVHAA